MIDSFCRKAFASCTQRILQTYWNNYIIVHVLEDKSINLMTCRLFFDDIFWTVEVSNSEAWLTVSHAVAAFHTVGDNFSKPWPIELSKKNIYQEFQIFPVHRIFFFGQNCYAVDEFWKTTENWGTGEIPGIGDLLCKFNVGGLLHGY